MLKNMKIVSKLVLIGGLLILIPLIIVGGLSVNRSKHSLNQATDEQLTSRSLGIAKIVEEFLTEQLRFVAPFTIMPSAISALEKLNTVGINEARVDLDRLNNYFEKAVKTEALNKDVQLFGLVDLKGSIISASAQKYIGVRIQDRKYFQTALTGKPNIGKIGINKVTGQLFLPFASPVQSDTGKVIGVIMYICNISFLNNLIIDEKIGKTGYAYIVDPTGLIISHPNPKHILKTNLDDFDGMTSISIHMKNGKSGVDRYVYKGVPNTAGYAPIKITGWSVGITLPDSEYLMAVNQLTIFVTIIAVIAIVIALTVFFFFAHSLAKSLNKGVKFAEIMSEGDLSSKLDIDQKDEIGSLAKSLNNMVRSLSSIVRNISNGSSTLSVTSSELRNVAEVLATGSDTTANKADTVAIAAEEMNANIESVAAAMEQTSANVNNIAAAVEEMNVNFQDITNRISKTKENTNHASEVSANSSVQVKELEKAATEIGSFTETINSIADKTSLLALNATIEAARAGDAGKGFAVVANEIKDLAHQVSQSTGDIGTKLNAIQGTTNTTIDGIQLIAEIITEVNESVDSITIAMHQQNDATREISKNINQTSDGIQEVNENISQTSQAVAQVSDEISNVNQSTSEISSSSAQLEQSADALMTLADQLGQQISIFTIDNRGFSAGPIKLAHSSWKRKLSDLLTGRHPLKVSDISSHKDCQFGQWYFGEGIKDYGQKEIFKKIDKKHEKVHTTAKEITELYNSGQTEKANQLYRNFTQITEDLFTQLDQLEEESI